MTTAKKNSASNPSRDRKKTAAALTTNDAAGSILATQAGPSSAEPDANTPMQNELQAALAIQKAGAQTLVKARPFNALKAGEHGLNAGHAPQAGEPVEPDAAVVTASTVSESISSEKTGEGATPGLNPANDSLDRVRVDSGGRALTTNLGMPVADNQNSLKAGLRGPTLMEDFVLREKITHFDHERIPERIVHARGSGAHGFFECFKPLTNVTKAAPFTEAGKRTPVFVRFSTVAGERGSSDLARDVRGFAVKFYTEDGNWDIVGNNMPVFFIQDAMKFPDLVHAVKPEPNNAIPQAASAHDTFWDFAGLMPEITHMLMWVMSDRALPRSYSTMQGFGVHTFRLVNDAGQSVFCKFHWNPTAGTHSVVWDEAVKISGADSDFHRRDLWEAIEAGAFPEWELGLQIFTEEQADAFSFDVLDATKLIPEELVPVQPVGRMVLNRNPDNFFAETEQVAFGTANLIPGIDTSNDPLLQGRHHSYHDTQLSRLGGPNFHELPINAALAQVHNNQRDGIHRQSIPRGRVAYEPNSLGAGCPFQAGLRAGFVPFPAPVFEDKVRGKPEKFADHFSQARLFFNSQSPAERRHIIAGFRFELTRVQPHAIRERVLSMLANVSEELVQGVADGLGIPVPPAMGPVLEMPLTPEVEMSPTLSLLARPGNTGVLGRRIALIVCKGVDGAVARATQSALLKAGAVARFLGAKLGTVDATNGDPLHVEVTLETAPAVVWDAVVVLPGEGVADALGAMGQAKEFLKDQYRHCKPMLLMGDTATLLDAAGIPRTLADGGDDVGLIIPASAGGSRGAKGAVAGVSELIAALSAHRNFDRETDPPRV